MHGGQAGGGIALWLGAALLVHAGLLTLPVRDSARTTGGDEARPLAVRLLASRVAPATMPVSRSGAPETPSVAPAPPPVTTATTATTDEGAAPRETASVTPRDDTPSAVATRAQAAPSPLPARPPATRVTPASRPAVTVQRPATAPRTTPTASDAKPLPAGHASATPRPDVEARPARPLPVTPKTPESHVSTAPATPMPMVIEVASVSATSMATAARAPTRPSRPPETLGTTAPPATQTASTALQTAPPVASAGPSLQDLAAHLHREIEAHKRYPASARRLGREGTAEVAFMLRPDGVVTDVVVAASAGTRALDGAALRAVRGIVPFAHAASYLDAPARFRVPIRFALR